MVTGLVGNHTKSHPHLPQLSDSDVRAQVVAAHASILRATAKDPHSFFRFPLGDYDTRTLRLVNNDLGYSAYGWSVDTLGWKGRAAGISVAQVAARIAAARAPGEIVLMHLGAAPDGSTLDADALDTRRRRAVPGHTRGQVRRVRVRDTGPALTQRPTPDDSRWPRGGNQVRSRIGRWSSTSPNQLPSREAGPR